MKTLQTIHTIHSHPDWPSEVDPATATAQIWQGNLVLTVKRVGAGANSAESKNSQIGR
jgi:proteasome lid subunit RPN8/RPN11